MKVVILDSYNDKKLKRKVKVGEIFDLTKERIAELKEVGVRCEEAKAAPKKEPEKK